MKVKIRVNIRYQCQGQGQGQSQLKVSVKVKAEKSTHRYLCETGMPVNRVVLGDQVVTFKAVEAEDREPGSRTTKVPLDRSPQN